MYLRWMSNSRKRALDVTGKSSILTRMNNKNTKVAVVAVAKPVAEQLRKRAARVAAGENTIAFEDLLAEFSKK